MDPDCRRLSRSLSLVQAALESVSLHPRTSENLFRSSVAVFPLPPYEISEGDGWFWAVLIVFGLDKVKVSNC